MTAQASGVSVVLLDLDGTLMDHPRAVRSALVGWLGEAATEPVVAAWFAALDRHLLDWRAGRISWTEQRRRRLIDFLPVLGRPVGAPEELDRVFAEGYLAHYGRSWTAYEDVEQGLAALEATGYRLAMLTNGSEHQQHAKLAALGLLDAVGPVFTAEGIGARKPDPAAFTIVCDRLGVAPAEVVYVGDEYEVDVLAARAAGLGGVLVDRDGAGPAEEQARIRSLRDLVPLLASPVPLR
jgi:putative hydrolase of the HAD superfamily